MENVIHFEERHKLYENIEEELHLQKLEETYSERYFGNYSVTFSAGKFRLIYSSDRSQLMLYVASNFELKNELSVRQLMNFMMGEKHLNQKDEFTLDSILQQNAFLKDNFEKISELLSEEQYKDTLEKISGHLKNEWNDSHINKNRKHN